MVDEVYHELTKKCGVVFDSPLFADPTTCKEVMAAILSRRRYHLSERIGCTDLTVDKLRGVGVFQWTDERRLECGFIFLVILVRKIPKMLGEVDNFDEHLTRSGLVWQRFEQFVALYRRVKSIAYCGTPVGLYEFHAGARFGSIDGIVIKELESRTVVETTRQNETKSGVEDATSFTNRDGVVEVPKMNRIIIKGASASASDIVMRVQLKIGKQQVHCNEVIRCKLLPTAQKIDEKTYVKEREKAVNEKSDVFLLITSAEATEFDLPPRCGIVSIKEFEQYFGPFASRAYRSLEPPNINAAEKIITEKKK